MIDFSLIPPVSWVLPSLEVRPSEIHGSGVFTPSPIRADEVVVVWGGVIITIDEFKAGKGLQHTNVGIDEGIYLASPPTEGITTDDYMNHSCDPNLWLRDEITLVARRDIKANEELTLDYATEVADEEYVMKDPCNCQGSSCRKLITGRDWRR